MKLYRENLVTLIGREYIENCDFKDWIIQEDLKVDNLKKWIRYYAGNYPDADCVLKMSDGGSIITELGWDDMAISTNHNYLDCIFSMATFFKAFLRFYVPEYMPYMSQIYENYDNVFSNDTKNDFCKKNHVARSKLDDLFKQLNDFARNTHTIGNYMPCPNNRYNFLKGNYLKYKDRLELFYPEIQDEKIRDWFCENKEKLKLNGILENSILLDFKFKGKTMCGDDIVPYTNYLKEVNAIIKERGKEIIKELHLD